MPLYFMQRLLNYVFHKIFKFIYIYIHKYLFIHTCFYRCLDQKFGKWKEAACVVKKAAKERPVYHYFVREPNQAKKNSERLSYCSELIIKFGTF